MPATITNPIVGTHLIDSSGNSAGDGLLSYVPHGYTPTSWTAAGCTTENNTPTALDFSVTISGVTKTLNISGYLKTDWLNGYKLTEFSDALDSLFPGYGFVVTTTFDGGRNYVFTATTSLLPDFSLIPIPTDTTYTSLTMTTQGAEIAQSLTYTAPNDSAGESVTVYEGAVTLTSGNGTAEITVNVTVDDLPAANTTATFTFPVSEIIDYRVWSFRRSSEADAPLPINLAITFADSSSHTITVDDKSVEIEIPAASHPVQIAVSLVGGAEGGASQTDRVYVSFVDTVDGRTSYARINAITAPLAAAVNYAITNNDPPAVRVLRDSAIERVRRGEYSGDVADFVRVLTAHDAEANKALIMLRDGSDFAELVRAGFSNTVSTQLLAGWFTVPSGEQAVQTQLLSKLARIRDMNISELAAFLTWADTNGVAIPLQDVQAALSAPVYDATAATSITGYIDGL